MPETPEDYIQGSDRTSSCRTAKTAPAEKQDMTDMAEAEGRNMSKAGSIRVSTDTYMSRNETRYIDSQGSQMVRTTGGYMSGTNEGKASGADKAAKIQKTADEAMSLLYEDRTWYEAAGNSVKRTTQIVIMHKMAQAVAKTAVRAIFIPVGIINVCILCFPFMALFAILLTSPLGHIVFKSSPAIATEIYGLHASMMSEIEQLEKECPEWAESITVKSKDGRTLDDVYSDIVMTYFVKYEDGEVGITMDESNRKKLGEVFNEMCSFEMKAVTQYRPDNTEYQVALILIRYKTVDDLIGENYFPQKQLKELETLRGTK